MLARGCDLPVCSLVRSMRIVARGLTLTFKVPPPLGFARYTLPLAFRVIDESDLMQSPKRRGIVWGCCLCAYQCSVYYR